MNQQRVAAAEEEVNKARSELDKARSELDKARSELDKAREEFNNFKATKQVPFYFEGSSKEYFTFLTQQVEKREAALKEREAALKEREAALIGLAQIEIAQEEVRSNSKKRKAGSTTSRTSGGELNQDSFRKRLLDRDTVCVLTGRGIMECDGCHIVPWVYFQRHDLIGKKIFDIVFPYSCDNPEHRIMDARNGILIWKALHSSFDKFDFTIIKKEGVYTVKTLEEHEFEQGTEIELLKTILALNGKKISFNSQKQNEWPGEKFLKFHNECFDDRRAALKAAAEEYSDTDEYDETIAERAESIQKSELWLQQNVHDSVSI